MEFEWYRPHGHPIRAVEIQVLTGFYHQHRGANAELYRELRPHQYANCLGQCNHRKNQQHQQQRSIVAIRCPLPTIKARRHQSGIGYALAKPKRLCVLLPKTRQQHPAQLGHGPFKKQSRRVGLGSPNGQSKPHQSGNLLPRAQQPTRGNAHGEQWLQRIFIQLGQHRQRILSLLPR